MSIKSIKAITLSLAIFGAFAAHAGITCRDLIEQTDELTGIDMLQQALASADKNAVPRRFTKMMKDAVVERDLILKSRNYSRIREAVIDACASTDQEIRFAISADSK